jgi:hypothetical protein
MRIGETEKVKSKWQQIRRGKYGKFNPKFEERGLK